ncbi:MAG: hypothetical protein HY356_03605 [Gammaproteobacteria bacterium]|nr:hypothetical protein [Gammaproteobacteria bacterium]
MPKDQKLQFCKFTQDNFFSLFHSKTRQVQYLERYLSEMEAKVILREPKYFDRDYLAEFAAFYSISSKGYVNICERLHFFSKNIGRRTLTAAVGGSKKAIEQLQDAYLGFIVKRPIPAAPLGRTVLKWFPDQFINTTPRVINPSRPYFAHIAGVELWVEGLAWQQQDTGVGACATISLWSMLHSSAFDDHHAIPTTADITRDAHKRHSFGTRVFPSKGLNILQIYEAIKERDLVPLITEGDVKDTNGRTIGFSKDRFASTCVSFIRSGYPVLIVGRLQSGEDVGDHAICCVGFRSCIPSRADPSIPDLADSIIEILYVHDDNLGPNVRVKIDVDTKMISDCEKESKIYAKQVVSLHPKAPTSRDGKVYPSPTDDYGNFIPTQLIVAAHSDIRTDPDTLHKAALRHASNIADILNHIAENNNLEKLGLTVSSRFIKITDYFGKELQDRLQGSSKELSKVRLGLSEDVNPMSLHIGVVRIGVDDATMLVDILYDTTDSDRNHPIFAHVAFNEMVATIIQTLGNAGKDNYGVCVKAY